jgi:hypothetical protein
MILKNFIEKKENNRLFVNYTGADNYIIKLVNTILNISPNQKILIIFHYDIDTNFRNLISGEYIRQKLGKGEKLDDINKKYIKTLKSKIEFTTYLNIFYKLLNSKNKKETIEDLTKDKIVLLFNPLINFPKSKFNENKYEQKITVDIPISPLSVINSLNINAHKNSKLIYITEDMYILNSLYQKQVLVFYLYPETDINYLMENKKIKEPKLDKLIENKTLSTKLNKEYFLKSVSASKSSSKSLSKSRDNIKRRTIYYKYKHIKEEKGKLLKQQVFLSQYIEDYYDKISSMLLFHGIGTGKTCTSITIAEKIMDIDPIKKILVILPARLKTNFIDELISDTCIANKYITKQQSIKYKDIKTSNKDKDEIRKEFLKKINENYEIVSFEKFRKVLVDSKNLIKTIEEITKDKIIIIDEVHNLISSMIKPKTFNTILSENKIPKKTVKINAIVLRLLTKLADKTCKMFFLTATPIFDNYGQFIELLLNLRPDIDYNNLKRKTADDIKTYINLLKGKISFYRLDDVNAYPSVKTDNILINMSESQYKEISKLKGINEDEDEEEPEDLDLDKEQPSNMFCITERQKSISLYDKSKKKLIFSDLKEYAPKLNKLFELIKQPGKHLIYSTFIKYCLELIAEYLEQNGWSNYMKTGIKKNKTFVLWDASLNDENKQNVKNILNSPNNIGGEKIKIILGSPSIKEGISFKHIQHLHQLDPVWNSSAKEQIEGRCIRYKSHEDIPEKHKFLKREVVIHNYILTHPKDDIDVKTCDYKIYFEIMEEKKQIIKTIEQLLSKVSIDYYLWTNNEKPENDSKSSNISVSKEKVILDKYFTMKNPPKPEKIKKEKGIKECPEGKILNPKTNRCIKANGIVAKKLLKNDF